jgi:hypothetical protein
MATSRLAPTIFWVIANKANAGKTTVSCALVRVLNANGIRAVGFKPYGGTNMKESIDFILEQYPRSECTLYGSDAYKLCQASPLTTSDLVEVVGPSYRLFDPRVGKSVLMRKGALMLGNRSFFQPADMAGYHDRPDIRRLVQLTNLPFHEATLLAPRSKAAMDHVQSEKVAVAFAHLLSLEPEAIVCEGAGARLPFWKEGPPVNHVFFVGPDKVQLYPRVDLSFRPPRRLRYFLGRQRVPVSRDLLSALHRRIKRPATRPIDVVEKQGRDAFTDELVAALLADAGLTGTHEKAA